MPLLQETLSGRSLSELEEAVAEVIRCGNVCTHVGCTGCTLSPCGVYGMYARQC